jgi:HK97 family phage prohead protease
MPWHIETDNPDCDGWAVVKDDDGTVEGCHTDEEAAEAQMAALYGSEAEEEEEESSAPPAAPAVEFAGRGSVRADREVRAGLIHVREGAPGEPVTVYGHAATFDQPYMVRDWLGEYEESIAPGAFDKTLQEADVRFYIDHAGVALARSSAGNLDLGTDETGLTYEARLPAGVSLVKDLAELMRAGVIRESSFAFQTVKDTWNDDYTKRRVDEVRLFDVSVVSLPANPAAAAGIRAALALRQAAPDLWTPELGAAVADALREGKVLSSSNAALVRDVVSMLEQLLAAAAPKDENDGARDAQAMMMRQRLVEVARRRR